MSWHFTKAGRITKRRKLSPEAQAVLDRLGKYLEDNSAEPVEILCGFWKDQQDAITYQELRKLVEEGYLDEVTARLWEQDYSVLVKERMPKIWNHAIIAGAASQPLMERALGAWTFNSQTPGVIRWIQSRGAEMVTVSTQTQKDAIALLLEDKMRNAHTVDELARLIRPCVGLYRQQASAVSNYYDSLIKALTEQHPRTRPARIRALALDKATKYAERLHRQRAMMIAQTEMAFAYNYGADEGIRQAQADFLIGRCEKRWCTSGDDNVCTDCAELDGKQIGMEERFYSGNTRYEESGLYPPLHPRCGCAVQYVEMEPPPLTVAKRDESGTVITNTPEKPATTRYGAEDVTEDWFAKAEPNSHVIEDLSAFIQDGKRYDVDGFNVVLDYKPEEKRTAELLETRLGGELFMVPRVNNPENVKTPDYIFRGMRFDRKGMGTSTSKNAVYNRLTGLQKQADNFVLDITGNPLGRAKIERQAAEIFMSQHMRSVRTLIIVEDDEIVRILARQ